MSKRFWRKKGKTDTELVARAEHAVWRTQDMVFEKKMEHTSMERK